MVCFSRSVYKFAPRHAAGWKNLIRKYYGRETEHKCVFDENTDTWSVDTGRVWNGKVFSKSLPNPQWPTADYPVTCPNLLYAAQKVDSLISERLRMAGREVLMWHDFPNKVDVRTLLACLKNTSHVTGWSYSARLQIAFLVLDKFYCILVTGTKCIDADPPSLDLDEGFRLDSGSVIFPEWAEDFSAWKTEFLTDPNANWDAQILQSRNF